LQEGLCRLELPRRCQSSPCCAEMQGYARRIVKFFGWNDKRTANTTPGKMLGVQHFHEKPSKRKKW